MEWDHIPDWAENLANTLLQAMRERDPYTYGHCRRVAHGAALLAKAAGLSEHEQKVIQYSSLFHDLGKIGIPDRILLKAGRLTPSEEEIMRAHPIMSEEIVMQLSSVPFFKSLLPGIRHHHERIDGAGYPDGVQGDHIPLTARVILIADTFDAMTTTRPYRKGGGTAFAYAELKKFAGRQFDDQLVKIFLKAHPTWEKVKEEISEEFIASHSRKAA